MVISDIVPPNKRSIRSIPLRNQPTTPVASMEVEHAHSTPSVRASTVPPPIVKKKTATSSESSASSFEQSALSVPRRVAKPEERLSYDDIHFDSPDEKSVTAHNDQIKKQQVSAPLFEHIRPHDYGALGDQGVAGDSEDTRGFSHIIWYSLVILGVVGIIIGGLYTYAVVYGGATIVVSPKKEKVEISGSFEFSKEQYSVIEKRVPVSFEVKASGEQKVDNKTKGQLMVYNEYSKDPQRFVAKTRFQTSDGKVYRAVSAITVPGYTGSGSTITPGKVAVEVVADVAGESQNISSGTLYLPGLANDVRYKKVYAKVETPLGGGAQGIQKVVSEKDVAEAYKNALDSLKKEGVAPLADVYDPAKFGLLPSLVFYESGNPAQVAGSAGDTASYKADVTIRGIALSNNKLQEVIKTFSRKKQGTSEVITVDDWSTLTAIHERKSQSPWIENPQKLRFTGSVEAVWYFNTEELKKAIAGKPKDALPQALGAFSGIEAAEAIIRPFWSTSFPSNTAEIAIVDNQVTTQNK